jgi:hypothetical protein
VDVVAATGVAVTAPLAASMARAGASTARVAPLVSCLVAGAPAPAPGTVSSAASTALGEGGEGSHLSGGARPPSLSSSFSSPDDDYSSVPGEESPCCSRSQNSSLLPSRRSRRRMLRSLLRAACSCSHCCAAHARARARGVGGSDCAAFTALICREQVKLQDMPTSRVPAEQGRRESTHQRADREHGEHPEGCVVVPDGPEVDGVPRPGGRLLPRSSCISKMRSGLSIRGTIRR